jgi:hypothetical protein
MGFAYHKRSDRSTRSPFPVHSSAWSVSPLLPTPELTMNEPPLQMKKIRLSQRQALGTAPKPL